MLGQPYPLGERLQWLLNKRLDGDQSRSECSEGKENLFLMCESNYSFLDFEPVT
jgi:hypothetical protein